ncbi:MAG: glycosyl hydrolase family 18 protein [Flavobacteriales bacterium]
MKKNIYATLLLAFSVLNNVYAQEFPYPALVGYWEAWNKNVKLAQIDPSYNVIEVSFATTKGMSTCNMEFAVPWFYSSANAFKADIQTLHNQNRKVLISIGGAADAVYLPDYLAKDTFVTTMNTILDTYPFDGIDLDLETSSLGFSNITLANPTDSALINIIDATKEILQHYQLKHGKRCFLTMAPEVLYVQGAINANGNGNYLPIIDALRDDLDLLMVQLYNAGSAYTSSGLMVYPATADYIIGLTESVILGYNLHLSGGKYEHFSGLPARKVAVGLPSCATAGGKYTDTLTVSKAVKYLLGTGPKPGTYTLVNPSATASLGGIMTWSINKDLSCITTPSNSFVRNFEKLYGAVGVTENTNNEVAIYPNPANDRVFVNVHYPSELQIYSAFGLLVLEQEISAQQSVDLSALSSGLYIIKVGTQTTRLIKE